MVRKSLLITIVFLIGLAGAEGCGCWSNTVRIEPIVFALNKEYADNCPGWEDQADKVIEAVNLVYAKNTLKQFEIDKYLVYNDDEYGALLFDPEECLEYFQDVGNRAGITYIMLISPDGITSEEFVQLYGSAQRTCATLVHKHDKRYPVVVHWECESDNSLLDEYRLEYLVTPVHEIGHLMGLGVPDWYLYQYSDCTGVDPLLPDYQIKDDPDFSRDPMVMPYTYVGEDLEFCELNAAIINRNLDLRYTWIDARFNWFSKTTRVYVTDGVGTPISGATIEVYCTRLGCVRCSTECSGVNYGQGVPSTSVPEQTLVTDENGYATYDGPVGGHMMDENEHTPCIAKAIKVYHNGKSAATVVRFMDLQMNYVLNNSDEHITHIVLE